MEVKLLKKQESRKKRLIKLFKNVINANSDKIHPIAEQKC